MRTSVLLVFVLLLVLAGDGLCQEPVTVNYDPLDWAIGELIPATKDIVRMHGEVFAIPYPVKTRAIHRFEVPPRMYRSVLALFDGAEVDKHPSVLYPEHGSIVILDKNDHIIRISWYWARGKTVWFHFSVGGCRFIAKRDARDQAGYVNGWFIEKLESGELTKVSLESDD